MDSKGMSSLEHEARIALDGTKAHFRIIDSKAILNVRINRWWTEFEEISKTDRLHGNGWNYYNDRIATKSIWGRRGIAIKMDDGWHILRDYYILNHQNDDIPADLRWQVR